jgi:hypothetical protein
MIVGMSFVLSAGWYEAGMIVRDKFESRKGA